MNRRSWLTSLLALPLIPSVLRANPWIQPKATLVKSFPVVGNTITFTTASSISVDMNCSTGQWTEVRRDGTSVQFIQHDDAKPSKDCSWSCHDGSGGHASFIAPGDIGPAEMKDRIRLAMEAVKS